MTTTAEFTREMNKHANTQYKTINSTYVIEGGRGMLSIWRHQRDGDADESKGEASYPHAWVLVARVFGEHQEVDRLYRGISSKSDVLALRDSDRNENHAALG